MSDLIWFSAAVKLRIDIEGQGVVNGARSVVVFRALDFDDAFQRALALGRGFERSFLNAYGHSVNWRLSEIETLDQLGSEIVDGREVYSEPLNANPGEAPAFRPEDSQPTSSGV